MLRSPTCRTSEFWKVRYIPPLPPWASVFPLLFLGLQHGQELDIDVDGTWVSKKNVHSYLKMLVPCLFHVFLYIGRFWFSCELKQNIPFSITLKTQLSLTSHTLSNSLNVYSNSNTQIIYNGYSNFSNIPIEIFCVWIRFGVKARALSRSHWGSSSKQWRQGNQGPWAFVESWGC